MTLREMEDDLDWRENQERRATTPGGWWSRLWRRIVSLF